MTVIPRGRTREVVVGSTRIGAGNPLALQSMCATKTQDIAATLAQIRLLEQAGADVIRIAIDSKADVEALKSLRAETNANLVVDLQENYRLAKLVAPLVQKFRYNPGHLHHHERERSVADKVKFLVDVAAEHDCAMRIGVNFGSLDPKQKELGLNAEEIALASACEHVELIESLGFKRFVVSLKSSNPEAVVRVNKEFALRKPEVPIHLGVTEAGLLPDGAIKTRLALEKLLPLGIGDTIRVSLTLPDNEKDKEIYTAREIISDIENDRFRSVPEHLKSGLNIISCPSCSRVENRAFVKLAQEVKAVTEYAKSEAITIAVMGCRVNGPGETDEADLGLWCAPNFVNLKKGEQSLGSYPYDQVIARLLEELDLLIAQKKQGLNPQPERR